MPIIDFYSLIIDQTDKTLLLKDELLLLLDKLLNDSNITDPNKLQKLAQLRAKIDIELKDF